MSDQELRELQRYLKTNLEDYSVWNAYILLGLRAGAFDPSEFSPSFVTFITDVPYISSQSEQFNYEYSTLWSIAQDRAAMVLHGVRNLSGQLSTQELLKRLIPLFNGLYAQINGRPAYTLRYSTDEYVIPCIDINDGAYTVYYEERHSVIWADNTTVRREQFITRPRSILDMTPQYIVDAAIYSAGSYHHPPDVDTRTIVVATTYHQLVKDFIFAIEEHENLDAYYAGDDPEDEIDYLTLTSEALTGVFRKFVAGPRILIQRQPHILKIVSKEFDIQIERPFPLTTPTASGQTPVTVTFTGAHKVTEEYSHAWRAVQAIWRRWLNYRLDALLQQQP